MPRDLHDLWVRVYESMILLDVLAQAARSLYDEPFETTTKQIRHRTRAGSNGCTGGYNKQLLRRWWSYRKLARGRHPDPPVRESRMSIASGTRDTTDVAGRSSAVGTLACLVLFR
jgi:hypothetical protein